MYGPVELVYVEEVEDHIAALKREAQIKTFTHAKKEAMVEGNSLPSEFYAQE
jgi:predicted GIY-YIG superfamily endonuclease